jgi:hypothetical protein
MDSSTRIGRAAGESCCRRRLGEVLGPESGWVVPGMHFDVFWEWRGVQPGMDLSVSGQM